VGPGLSRMTLSTSIVDICTILLSLSLIINYHILFSDKDNYSSFLDITQMSLAIVPLSAVKIVAHWLQPKKHHTTLWHSYCVKVIGGTVQNFLLLTDMVSLPVKLTVPQYPK